MPPFETALNQQVAHVDATHIPGGTTLVRKQFSRLNTVREYIDSCRLD
jgi:hypothetical protein